MSKYGDAQVPVHVLVTFRFVLPLKVQKEEEIFTKQD